MAEKKQVQAGLHNSEPEFTIQRLYIKDLSFEVPSSPLVFLEKWQPEVNMELATKANDLGEDNHEIILTVTINVTMKDKPIFLAEVHQGGIFTIKNFPKEQMCSMLGSFCPNILYPYAREAITDMVMRGGFPQLYLVPINFDTLLEQEQHNRSQDDKRVH